MFTKFHSWPPAEKYDGRTLGAKGGGSSATMLRILENKYLGSAGDDECGHRKGATPLIADSSLTPLVEVPCRFGSLALTCVKELYL